MDAVGTAARAIKRGEAELMIAGGVESMSRAPFVMGKAESAFSRSQRGLRHDHRLALRQPADEGEVRRRLDARDGRERRDRLQDRARGAGPDGAAPRSRRRSRRRRPASSTREIVPVTIAQKKGDPIVVAKDEHPRETSLEALAKLKGVVRPDGTVTAGNASGVNDGACALLLASEARGGAPRPDAARARRRHGDGRRGAAHHGHRPGAGDAEGARADRPDARRRST